MEAIKPYKKSASYSFTFGIFPTLQLLTTNPQLVTSVYLDPQARGEGIEKIKQSCKGHDIQLVEGKKIFARLKCPENTYALAVFKKFETSLDTQKPHVVLAQPDDAGNLGTILRSMLGFGFYDLAVIRPGADIFDPKVVRASMGAIFDINCVYFDNFEQYQSQFSHKPYPFMLSATQTLEETHVPPGPYCLIFGNEGSGLPDNFKAIGTPLKIAHSPAIDSLNLAVAVSIALHSCATQPRKKS